MKRVQILPSKTSTDRIVPWLTVSFVICGGIFGLVQYSRQLHSERVQETMKFVREYQAVQKDGSSVRASLEGLLEKARQAVGDATVKITMPANDHEKAKLRQQIIKEVVHTVQHGNLEPKVNEVLDFLTVVAICAREGSCDTRATTAYFGGAMFDFVNGYCGYLEEYGRKWSATFGDEIFWFVYKNRVHLKRQKSPGQEARFFCDRYREIESRRWTAGLQVWWSGEEK